MQVLDMVEFSPSLKLHDDDASRLLVMVLDDRGQRPTNFYSPDERDANPYHPARI
jgi:hypothetical protein